MKNCEIPYSTATWGIVEDASEPAPFLSVVASRNGKWTRVFALFERQSLEKKQKSKPKRTLKQDKICSPPLAAACVQNLMVNGFETFT